MQREINMNIRRKTLIFHSEWLDIARGMRENEKYQTLESIIEYGLTGKRPDVPDNIDAVLDYTQPKIEKDYGRFVEYVNKNNIGLKGYQTS